MNRFSLAALPQVPDIRNSEATVMLSCCQLKVASWFSSVLGYVKYATIDTRLYPKVSGLVALRENCKWYSSLPRGAVVSLFCESV
jgi:hypothetical protein